jgi:hypothetical protein
MRRKRLKHNSFLMKFLSILQELIHKILILIKQQGRKRPLDTPKRMIERREREGKREKER